MSQLAGWLSSNTAALSILGAAIAFIWSTAQQVGQRKAEAREREFQAFHKLVRDLTLPDPTDGKVSIDRGAAVVFELRHFSRYYKFTERMLLSLKERLATSPEGPVLFLIEEIDLTLAHIQQNK
jgi:hypothetical protein